MDKTFKEGSLLVLRQAAKLRGLTILALHPRHIHIEDECMTFCADTMTVKGGNNVMTWAETRDGRFDFLVTEYNKKRSYQDTSEAFMRLLHGINNYGKIKMLLRQQMLEED